MDERWRDSYDTWKLASPYDDDRWHDEDDLRDPDYAEFVINLELDFESLIATYR